MEQQQRLNTLERENVMLRFAPLVWACFRECQKCMWPGWCTVYIRSFPADLCFAFGMLLCDCRSVMKNMNGAKSTGPAYDAHSPAGMGDAAVPLYLH